MHFKLTLQYCFTGAIQKLKDCLDSQIKILYKHHKNLAETQDCLARCYAISG